MPHIAEIARKFKALTCLECGKCSSLCPVTRFDSSYGPRKALRNFSDDQDLRIETCLTCGACEERCPQSIPYINLVRAIRQECGDECGEGTCAHGGVFQTLARLMAEDDFEQERLDWVGDDLEVAEQGEVLFFTGCSPYFDAYFQKLDPKSMDGVHAAVKVLNHLGVKPVLMKDERCCGHDQLWSGDIGTFRELARRNAEKIKETGAKLVLTGCAECARTLKLDYPETIGNPGFEVQHLSEYLAEKLPEAGLSGNGTKMTVSFQDPCRLGRHMGVYDAPREVFAALPGVELSEMARSGKEAECCGTSRWTECGAVNKQNQLERLEGARKAGAQVLVTSCPKCKIHFRCTQSEQEGEPEVQVEDLATVVARFIE
jgi:Fe-S oxidoreductase